jgi:pimeloyl-ACP methyl ester carboxylesterase
MRAETRYARSGDVHIAYQVIGNGPLDLVFSPSPVSNLEVGWEWPPFARFLGRLAAFSRLILFDKRGTGLSDRVTEAATLEERMDDVRAVMDAAGSERAAIFGSSEGGPMALLFAATYPERVSSLILYGSYARAINAVDYDAGVDPDVFEFGMEMMESEWGNCALIDIFSPSVRDDEAFRSWWGRYERQSASPGAAVAIQRLNAKLDVRPILPSVRVPTLILYRAGEFVAHVEGSKYLARHIAGATYVELDGIDYHPYVGDQDAILDRVEEFLTGTHARPAGERVLATLVRITTGNCSSPDSRDAVIARLVGGHGGEQVIRAGDASLATFDGPSRAIACALAVRDAMTAMPCAVRIVAHIGEIERRGSDISGTAVDRIGAIGALAAAGEVLISRTLADLVAGSEFVCTDVGEYVVAGATEPWRLFAVMPPGVVPQPVEPRSPTGVFRREGDTWLVGMGGQTVRLRASKGLSDIATLVARPGREVHVIELMGVATEMGGPPVADRLLDEQAIAEYRSRLSELAQEADEADAMHDLGRATSAHAEYDALVARLSADLGLGGKSRLSDQWPERARKSVRKRVQDALVRIEAENPPLGQHLRQTIRTGAFCVYDPPDPVSWVL